MYWGEGQKKGNVVSLSNSDPRMVVFFVNWLERCFGLDRLSGKIKFNLQLYSDMDSEKEVDFWANNLDISVSLINKPFIKKSTYSGLSYWSFGHGTCRVVVGDVKIRLRILALIEHFSSMYLGPSFNGSDRTLIKS